MKDAYDCFVKIMMKSGIEYEIDNVDSIEVNSFFRAIYYEMNEPSYKIHGEVLNLNQIESTGLAEKEDGSHTLTVYTVLGREYKIVNISKLEVQNLYDAMLNINTPLFHKLGDKMINLREVEVVNSENREYYEDYDIPDEYFSKGED